MIESTENFSRRRPVRLERLCGRIFGAALWLAANAALATVPNSNELGVQFKVLKSGATATVEIRITPRRDFDSVAIEAASGVTSLTPSCAFTKVAVVAGGSYVCQVNVAGMPSEAAMTLNVVARRAVPGSTVPVMEVHHLSIKNAGFAASKRSAATSHHDVVSVPMTPK